MVLITTTLYELIWSKQKGLSHKHASSSIAEKKVSLLWSSETSNIVISSPNSNYGGERSDCQDLSKHKPSSLQLDSHMKDKDYKWVTTVGSPISACGSSMDMKEFMEKDDEVSQEKHVGDKHNDEKENNYPPYNNDFQLHDAKPETVFIQEKDFKSGPENYSASTKPSKRTKKMSNLEVDCESHHRTELECSKEFSGKYDCKAPCLAIVSSYQDPTLTKDVTPTNISSASTSRPTNVVFSMDVKRRNKNVKLESHHRNWDGRVSSKVEKGKEKIIYEADDSRSSSNRREDGRESFECISSRGIVSTVKRARTYDIDSEKLVGGKSLKRLNNGNFSFMNWVTTITNGIARAHDAPMEAFQHPSQHMKRVISPPSISHEEREYIDVSHGTKGFRSIFQAVYHPDYNVSSNKIKFVDHQKERDALEGTEGEKASNVACSVLRKRFNFGQNSSFPDSSFSFGDGEKESISTGPVTFGAYGIAPRKSDIELHDKVLASSKRSNKDVCQVKNSPLAAMDSCAELMTQSRHAFQNSLWITRLSPGVSSPQLQSIECSNCLDLSAEHKISYLEAKKNRLTEKPQHSSVRIVTDNCESKLQLTISSKYCKRSKPMTSSFAQRLEALKHTNSSKITDENTIKNEICLFCGMSDHSIRECSEVVETKLDQYLKSISMYDSIKKASCFCILCFQLDHWAASCPNDSSEGNQISFKANCLSDVNFKSTTKKKCGNQSFISYDAAIMLSESMKDHHQVVHGSTVSQKENKVIESDFVVCAEVRSHKNESAGCGTINLCIDRVEDSIHTEKVKMTASCSSENELKKSEFKSFCSHLPTTVMNEPKGIFVAVRKLRLSRMDILRWMKSKVPHYNIGGFFLRLRIGKLEKGLGGTGYHVACINGASCQSSISVCVGSSTYSVTSPFISNQDFNEDELMAWWFQNLRDGTKMPSSEELNEKFQLRLKFGF